MREILPGVFHWTTFHEGIRQEVHSCLVTAVEPAVLIDPREPEEGCDWFRDHGPPGHTYLTNRLHYRHSDLFARAFGTVTWCHRAGLHRFEDEGAVRPFEHGDELPGGITAIGVGSLCPEETALYIPREGGILALGDALIREGPDLSLVPDALMGEDPARVKRGLKKAFEGLLLWDFKHLLLAHGEPLLDTGKRELVRFVGMLGED